MLRRAARIILFVLIGSAAAAGGIWLLAAALEDRETKYEGKTVANWVVNLRSTNVAVATAAKSAVTNRVIPALTGQLFNDTNDSQLKLKLVEKLNSLPYVAILAVEAPTRRAAAARSLGEFQADGASAIPELIRCVKGEDAGVRASAIEALGKIRAEPSTVIPLLIRCLDEPDEDIKISATESLAQYGAQAKAAVPKLLPLLHFPSKELPSAARQALKMIDSSALPANETH